MAVQKRRQSSARRDSRRAQWMASVKIPNVSACPQCGETKVPHRICMKCGWYNGREIVEAREETTEEQG